MVKFVAPKCPTFHSRAGAMKMKLNRVDITDFLWSLIDNLIRSFHRQAFIMYWNGGTLALTEDLTGIDGLDLAIPLNIILTQCSLFAYFKSKKNRVKNTFRY